MSTSSTLATNDLRSEAKTYQRDRNHNTKWTNGTIARTGITCPHQYSHPVLASRGPNCPECLYKPMSGDHNASSRKAKRNAKKKLNSQTSSLARKAFRNELVDATDGPIAHVSDHSSSDEDVHDASCAPVPAGADFMYSYDAARGPRDGNDVLSLAITKAVQRFENNEVEKLVNKEYNVIDENYAADEDEDDDFEMIEYSHLK